LCVSVYKNRLNILQMPYLHFETNEGRIRLSNAIKRTMTSTQREIDDDAKSVSAGSDSSVNTSLSAPYKDNFLSDSDSDEDDINEVAKHEVDKFKSKP
jgi:hypothetical protein